MNSLIIYLIGKPGVGKYTIAKELTKKHNLIICDNQLINNAVFELLQYDGYCDVPEFAWDTIAKIRTEIFQLLIKLRQKNYVLTNCLADNLGDRELYQQVESLAKERGSIFVPVKLMVKESEHLKRIVQAERKQRWKSVNPKDVFNNEPEIKIVNPNLLAIDTSDLSAKEAADIISEHIMNCLKK